MTAAGFVEAGGSASSWPKARLLFEGDMDSERAPWDTGNTFAPWVLYEDGRYRLWYGGQGRDGHDRIHYAESLDGIHFPERRVVLEHPEHNLINDPCVVKVADRYHMFYTVAEEWIVDTIHHAVSDDGIHWERRGEIVGPGPAGRWDGLLVGRPSVLYEDGRFRMWFDASSAFYPGLGQGRWPEDPAARRRAGYAESVDGDTWVKHDAPVHGPDVGSVHVTRHGRLYVMLHESRTGTLVSVSEDGMTWRGPEPFVKCTVAPLDDHGHVTPHLFVSGAGPHRVYMGLARARAWTENVMGMATLPTGWVEQRAHALLRRDVAVAE